MQRKTTFTLNSLLTSHSITYMKNSIDNMRQFNTRLTNIWKLCTRNYVNTEIKMRIYNIINMNIKISKYNVFIEMRSSKKHKKRSANVFVFVKF